MQTTTTKSLVVVCILCNGSMEVQRSASTSQQEHCVGVGCVCVCVFGGVRRNLPGKYHFRGHKSIGERLLMGGRCGREGGENKECAALIVTSTLCTTVNIKVHTQHQRKNDELPTEPRGDTEPG